MPRQLKLMPDYQSFPLWRSGSDEPGNVDPAKLPLSKATVQSLEKWAHTFDSWLDSKDPASSKGPTIEQLDAFERQGIEFWERLREELGHDYEVVYRSVKRGRILTDPSLADEERNERP